MKKNLLLSSLVTSVILAFPVHAASNTKLGKAAAGTVEEAPLRGHLALISSDSFEGRGTGQRGGDLTVQYLENQAQVMGLTPGNGKSYRQLVKIAGVKAQPEQSSLQLLAGGKPLAIEFGKDWIWAPGDAAASHQFDTDVVFVGYGISAPEEKWDDYKGQDVSGKLLVMMVNDPQEHLATFSRCL